MRLAAFGKCGNSQRLASEMCLGSRLSSLGAARLKRQGYNLKRRCAGQPATSKLLSDEMPVRILAILFILLPFVK